MNMPIHETLLTPEDLLRMERGPRYELVHGYLLEKPMGHESDSVGSRLISLLDHYSNFGELGLAFGSGAGYQLWPDDPRRVRYPDVSFIRRERLPEGRPARGHSRVAPDLAVEVISPNDLARHVDARVDDFLRAGTPLVWTVSPDTRWAVIYRADGSGGWRREDQELDGGDVLPGFKRRVADLFRGIPRREVETTDEPPPK